MFGSNSPQYSERALDHRVRLAHPDSQIQLSNSFEIIRCRVERQPSIVTLLTNAVKPRSNFRPVYFRPTGPRTKTPIPQGFVSPRHSRRVCIVTDPNIGGNPQPCNSIARQRAVTSTDQQRPRNHHARGPRQPVPGAHIRRLTSAAFAHSFPLPKPMVQTYRPATQQTISTPPWAV